MSQLYNSMQTSRVVITTQLKQGLLFKIVSSITSSFLFKNMDIFKSSYLETHLKHLNFSEWFKKHHFFDTYDNGVCAVDTEFYHEGWNMQSGQLCQIGAYLEKQTSEGNVIPIEFNEFIKCDRKKKATQREVPECVAISRFKTFLDSNHIHTIIGHSPLQDTKLLQYSADRCKVKLPPITVLDTLDACHYHKKKSLYTGRCQLKAFSEYILGPNNFIAHDALDDAKMTYKVYNKTMDHIQFSFDVFNN